MLWINNPAGETGKKIGIKIGPEIEIKMLDIGVLIEILTEIKVGHLVGTGIQNLLVGHLDIGIIGRIEIETEIGIEIETIEGIEVHLVMVMITPRPRSGSGVRYNPNIICRYCQEIGHIQTKCPQLEKDLKMGHQKIKEMTIGKDQAMVMTEEAINDLVKRISQQVTN